MSAENGRDGNPFPVEAAIDIGGLPRGCRGLHGLSFSRGKDQCGRCGQHQCDDQNGKRLSHFLATSGRRVRTAPAKIRLIKEADNPWLEVTIVEGRNRQIRKMFEEVGHHVEKIRRVKYGPLTLDVPPGEFRSLTLEEIARLKAAASGETVRSSRRIRQ